MTETEKSSSRVIAWLQDAVQQGASDLHLVENHPPILRLHGRLLALDEESLTPADLATELPALCPPETYSDFECNKNVDIAFQLEFAERPHRFRANFFVSGEVIGGCIRIIPEEIPSFEWTGFPRAVAHRLTGFQNGLVVVAGVTGAGKTTTLAMLINLLNHAGGYRIITIEEPIEYIFPQTADSLVTQRQVGTDVVTFADGLKYGLRQDPDVILVGEIRDRETAQMALSAAETGHLVFTTLHSRDAKGTISRLCDLFPQSSQTEIRAQLAMSLRAVVNQHLLPDVNEGESRHLAIELLYNTPPVSSAIRFGKIETIDNSIVTGRSNGMITLDESLKQLLNQGNISPETAGQLATDQRFLDRLRK